MINIINNCYKLVILTKKTMKRIFLLAIVLIVSACSNSDDSSDDSITIFGEWELYSISEDGYDDIDGYEILPTIEFISPNTLRMLEHPYHGEGGIRDYIGTFSLTGDILTQNFNTLNGEPYSTSPDVYVDVIITKNTLVWGYRYDDGSDSGYITYSLRRMN
jgi:hypothetical protein